MKRADAGAAAIVTFVTISPGAIASDDCADRLAGGGVATIRGAQATGASVAWRTVPAPIPVGRPFALEWVACAADGVRLGAARVDAWMPDHRHGMNYTPTLAGTPPGPMRAEGLVMHMPGRWQLVFEFEADGRPLRLTTDVVLR